ncbi:putative cysteine desulfurase [compost metagenome]
MNSILTENSLSALEYYFSSFRENTIGIDHSLETVVGKQKLLYADWMECGRLYAPIEDIVQNKISTMISTANSHSNETGKASRYAYQHAQELIKMYVNASESDVLVATGTSTIDAVSKLQRIMGLRSPDNIINVKLLYDSERPVVFITHMEHHSNQVSWMETIADVVILPADKNLLVDPEILSEALKKYSDRNLKIGSFTACSNVTGIITPYYELAKIMHQHGGLCFVDFTASAPYVKIDMHPENQEEYLDAIFFSPYKFLGGPGTSGILVFNKKLYQSNYPDNPGGENVKWTNPWGGYQYYDTIEIKEDSGTPGFLQVIRTALCFELKEKMGIENIKNREHELLSLCYDYFEMIPSAYILGDKDVERIGCLSFGIFNVHYNLIVRLLNDRFGIQASGGWSCASTYAHYLFDINEDESKTITNEIRQEDFTNMPGWVRLSLHPITTNEELIFICNAINEIANNYQDWQKSYKYNSSNNEFELLSGEETIYLDVEKWFYIE